MLKIISKIKEVIAKAKGSINRLVIKSKCHPASMREILCNNRGSIIDVALGVVISVIIAVIILTALKSLFNVTILPSVTDRTTSLFS
jgi:hypothetical protein